jgi:DNA primase
MQKKHILPALAVGLALGTGALVIGSSQVSAWMGNGQGNRDQMVQQLAERFGLNEDEVQSFMEEKRAEHMQQNQEQRQTEFEERLSTAVTDGKITEEQKQVILDKHAQMQAQFEANKEDRQAAREERQAERESHHQEMEAWAEENGIDMEVIMELMGGPREGQGPMGPGQGRHFSE